MSNPALKVVFGNSNPELNESIKARMEETCICKAIIDKFSDGETQVRILDNVRGTDVFIVQATCPPVNDNLMELLLIADALHRASAKRITAVIPYYGYARQDRKSAPRVPISAKLVADLIATSKIDRVITMDLHAGQIQGFFGIPVDNLQAYPMFIDYINTKKYNIADLVVVSPDAGGTERARIIAERIGASLAIIDKRREKENVAKVMNLIGKVSGKHCVIVDDMCDTAGSLVEAIHALKKKGAQTVIATIVHPVLSGPALQRIRECHDLDELIVSNTIPLKEGAPKNIKVLDIGNAFVEAIRCVHHEESISKLFTR